MIQLNLSKVFVHYFITKIILFSHTISLMNSFMDRKKIRPELQTRIREYLKFIWQEQKTLHTEEEEKIKNSLSVSLKEELMLEVYGFFLKNNPLFTKSFSDRSLRQLVFSMKEVSLTPNDIIYSV